MKLGDLTTLANVKAWLMTQNYTQANNDANTSIDALLSRLISRWSEAIRSELERPWILPKTYVNDAYDGHDGSHQFLRNWPVNSVSQVSVNGIIIPPSPIVVGSVSFGYGFRFETWDGIPPGGPQAVDLIGSCYYRGKLNVLFTYNAGYLISEESQLISAPIDPATISEVQVIEPYGIWAQDVSVTYNDANKTPLTAVTSTPAAAGQYQVVVPDRGTPLSLTGKYIFYTGPGGDTGKTVLISYGFIPAALEQAATELVCERFMYRGRIGEESRTIAQQVTAKYDTKEFPNYVQPVLQRYRSILPI